MNSDEFVAQIPCEEVAPMCLVSRSGARWFFPKPSRPPCITDIPITLPSPHIFRWWVVGCIAGTIAAFDVAVPWVYTIRNSRCTLYLRLCVTHKSLMEMIIDNLSNKKKLSKFENGTYARRTHLVYVHDFIFTWDLTTWKRIKTCLYYYLIFNYSKIYK